MNKHKTKTKLHNVQIANTAILCLWPNNNFYQAKRKTSVHTVGGGCLLVGCYFSVGRHCRRPMLVRNDGMHHYIYFCAPQVTFKSLYSGLIWEIAKSKENQCKYAEHVLNKPYGESSKQNEKVIIKRFIVLGKLEILLHRNN